MNRIVIGLSLALASVSVVGQQNWKAGDSAPKFTVEAMDGGRLTIEDLERDGNFFLYFVHDGDTVNDAAKPYIDRIVNAYVPSKIKWYAVVDMKGDRARSWSSETTLPYHVLLDTDGAVRRLFKVTSSPTIVEIGSDGKIKGEWEGYSGDGLKRLNGHVARVNNRKRQAIDFSSAPSVTQYGRPYGTW